MVDETQISKPLEPTMNHNLMKWLILLPIRAELLFTLQYEIPCTWQILIESMLTCKVHIFWEGHKI